MIAVRCHERPGRRGPDDGNRVPLSRAHHLALSHSSRVMRQVQSMPCPAGAEGVSGSWPAADPDGAAAHLAQVAASTHP
jgi:hypothetical protein